METRYSQWIADNYPTPDCCKNKCNEAVRAMTAKFPELKVQVGRANGVMHCWAIDENNIIVDPTCKQFDHPIRYSFIADRFLNKNEYEPATGAIFLDDDQQEQG